MISRALPLSLLLALGTVASAQTVGVSFDRATVLSLDSVQMTVTLSSPAPAGGATVAVTSPDPAVTIDSPVTVPAGAASVTVPVFTKATFRDRIVTATPSLAGFAANSGSFLLDGNDATVTLSQSPVTPGANTPLRVRVALERPAPDYLGFDIHLPVGVPGFAYFYAFPVVKPNEQTTEVQLPTIPVDNDMVLPLQVFPYGGSSFSVDTTPFTAGTVQIVGIKPTLTLSQTAVTPGSVLSGTWSIAYPVDSGISVRLGAYGPATISPTYTGLSAGQTSVAFTVTAGTSVGTVKVYAQREPSTQTAVFRVANQALALIVPPQRSQTYGKGRVVLSVPAPAGGLRIYLASSDDAVLRPAASVLVPEGATSAEFSTVTGDIAAPATATVTAVAGSLTQATSVPVTPVALKTLAISATTIKGGAALTGTVTLDTTVGVNTLVAVTSDDPSVVVVPSSTTVVKGNASRTFTINTKKVTAAKFVKITVTKNGKSLYRTLKVTP